MEPCLLKFCRAGRGTRLQFCNAFLVADFSRGRALQFDGRLVGARVGVFRARVQLIAARHSAGVVTFERAHLLAALLDLRSQLGNLYRQRCLLAIHLRNPAGQYHAQPRAHLITQARHSVPLWPLAV